MLVDLRVPQELDTCRTQIAELAAGVRAQLPEQAYPMRIMQTISHHLFAEQGFRGNRQVTPPPLPSLLLLPWCSLWSVC